MAVSGPIIKVGVAYMPKSIGPFTNAILITHNEYTINIRTRATIDKLYKDVIALNKAILIPPFQAIAVDVFLTRLLTGPILIPANFLFICKKFVYS